MIEIGDYVKARGNYWDEQLGEHAYMDIQRVTDVNDAPYGRLVKVDHEKNEWISVGWFDKVEPRRIVIAAIKKNGIVFTGLRHGHIIRDMVGCGFLKDPKEDYVYTEEQGFVDNHGKYWSREDARDVAVEAGQVDSTHGTLYSEDLW